MLRKNPRSDVADPPSRHLPLRCPVGGRHRPSRPNRPRSSPGGGRRGTDGRNRPRGSSYLSQQTIGRPPPRGALFQQLTSKFGEPVVSYLGQGKSWLLFNQRT